MLKKAVQQGRSERSGEGVRLGTLSFCAKRERRWRPFFSILLGFSAFRTSGGFFCCVTLFGGQGKELLALPAGANFEVGSSLVVNVSGQEQFQWVISDRTSIGELDDGQAIVKDFKVSFLSFSGQDMPDDEHRLSLTLRSKVS